MKKLTLGLLLCMLTIGITAEFNKGIDLTGKTAITISQLHQLVDQAYPATDRGMVIVTNNTPNTGANSYYTNYLWYDISTSPPQLKSFYTNGWILATIPAGSVGTVQLEDYGVTAVKLGTNSVNTYAVSNNAVTTDKIASSAVTEDKIYNQAVSSNKLANDAIYTASIADRQVTGAKMASGTITYTNLADNSIRNEAITNGAVDTVSITNGTILAEDIAGNTIAATNIAASGTAYQVLRVNSGATAVEWGTPIEVVTAENTFDTLAAYNTGWATNLTVNTLSDDPDIIQVYLEKIATNVSDGHSEGDRLYLSGTRRSADAVADGQFQWSYDTSTKTVYVHMTPKSENVWYVTHLTTGAYVAVSVANLKLDYKIVAKAIKFNL